MAHKEANTSYSSDSFESPETWRENHQSRRETVEEDPPFTSECEVFHEGGPEASHLFDECKKNPGHPTFIPVNELEMSHLPQGYRTEKRMKHIKACCDRTVRVVVKYTSEDRPDTFPNSTAPYPFVEYRGCRRKTRCGTGYVSSTRSTSFYHRWVHGVCPCHLCRVRDVPENAYQVLVVATAAHVVFDNREAEHAVFELFYDNEDRKTVKYLYGVRLNPLFLQKQCCDQDKVQIVCVSHDPHLKDIFRTFEIHDASPVPDDSLGCLISHPHGRGKRVSFGHILKTETPVHFMDFKLPRPESFMTYIRRKYRKGSRKTGLNYAYRIWRLCNRRIFLCKLPLDSIEPPKKLFTPVSRSRGGCNEKTYLVKDVQFLIPKDSTYVVRNEKFGQSWVKFPAHTKIERKNNTFSKSYFILPDMEFSIITGPTVKFYSIDSCPGCSGAPIIRKFTNLDVHFGITHAGALKNGTNRSAAEYSN